jgi:hypothetical protein
MIPETAMRQAQETAYWYFKDAATALEEIYPGATADAKAIAASHLANAAALDYLAAELGGRISGSDGLFTRGSRRWDSSKKYAQRRQRRRLNQ